MSIYLFAFRAASVPLTQMLAGIGLEPAGAPPPGWPGCRPPPCAVHGAAPGRSPCQAEVCRRPRYSGSTTGVVALSPTTTRPGSATTDANLGRSLASVDQDAQEDAI